MKSAIFAIAFMFTATAANAADFYLTAAGQYQDAETDLGFARVDSDGYGGVIGFGWDFATDTDIEIQLDYAEGKDEDGFEASQASLSFNAYYAPMVGVFQPRIGVGLGAAALDVEGSQEEPQLGFMTQASGGFYVWAGDHFAIGPNVRYRYTNATVDGLVADTFTLIGEFGVKVRF